MNQKPLQLFYVKKNVINFGMQQIYAYFALFWMYPIYYQINYNFHLRSFLRM